MQESKTAKILLVDDDLSILSQLRLGLSSEFEVQAVSDPETAWDVIQRERPDLITLDLAIANNDPETGFSVLERCMRLDPFMKVILITGNNDRKCSMRAIAQGASDVLGKPFDLPELRVLIRRNLQRGRLERENAALADSEVDDQRLGALVGSSPPMKDLFARVQRVAPPNVAVLIQGESGTGKDLVAREVHRLSPRANEPFIKVDCAAIPDNLIESELFGHEKGSFTGAHTSRVGLLEVANKGTVFLDEIGEVSLAVQVKLLRFLQEHVVLPVGGRSPIDLDVRVIAATNKDLKTEVREGRVREDLFFRLSVLNLETPPLRDRRGDILLLAQFFLDRYCEELGRRRLAYTARARLVLQRYNWPGNVRELENIIHTAAVMTNGKFVDAADLDLAESATPRQRSLKEARLESDRQAIPEALRATKGNISLASRILGISRPSLHELLRKLEIDASDYKPSSGMDAE